MNTRFKWLVAIGTILAVVGTTQGKNPPSSKPASDSEADDLVTMGARAP